MNNSSVVIYNSGLSTKSFVKQQCKKDFIYFCTVGVYIRETSTGKLIGLQLTPTQIKFASSLQQNNKMWCLHARQIGASTILNCYILWLSIFYPNEQSYIKTYSQYFSRDSLRRIYELYQTVPNWLKPGCQIVNKGDKLSFKNKSTIEILPSQLRGMNLKDVNLFFDTFDSLSESVQRDYLNILTQRSNYKNIVFVNFLRSASYPKPTLYYFSYQSDVIKVLLK